MQLCMYVCIYKIGVINNRYIHTYLIHVYLYMYYSNIYKIYALKCIVCSICSWVFMHLSSSKVKWSTRYLYLIYSQLHDLKTFNKICIQWQSVCRKLSCAKQFGKRMISCSMKTFLIRGTIYAMYFIIYVHINICFCHS